MLITSRECLLRSAGILPAGACQVDGCFKGVGRTLQVFLPALQNPGDILEGWGVTQPIIAAHPVYFLIAPTRIG